MSFAYCCLLAIRQKRASRSTAGKDDVNDKQVKKDARVKESGNKPDD